MKIKLVSQQEFVICGFTQGEREYFGALVLGIYANKQADLGRERRHRVRSANRWPSCISGWSR